MGASGDPLHAVTSRVCAAPVRLENGERKGHNQSVAGNSHPPRPAHVLLVDDEPMLLRALTRHLEHAGYVVTSCIDGASAVEALEEAQVDVVISDVTMPEMSGVQLLRAIRRQHHTLPVVLMSGAPDVKSAVEALEHGAFRYLLKPIAASELLGVVARAVRLRALALVQQETLAVLGTGIGCPGELATLEAEFAQAVGSLWMAFQPLVCSRERRVFGYEALLRTSGCSLVEPSAVLNAAERLDAVWSLGRAIRAQVARQLTRTDHDAVMFVNLHPWDLMDPDLYDDDAPLTRFAQRVVLEVTERAALDRVHDVQGRVGLLRGVGFRIAVDDLGAGYAGLASFAQLEPDIVKLDISLIRGIHGSLVKRRLVSSMVTLCQELGSLVVAEGIETEAERDALVDLGCDLLQGFRFAKPGPPLPRACW